MFLRLLVVMFSALLVIVYPVLTAVTIVLHDKIWASIVLHENLNFNSYIYKYFHFVSASVVCLSDMG